jgi:hypothetical protein
MRHESGAPVGPPVQRDEYVIRINTRRARRGVLACLVAIAVGLPAWVFASEIATLVTFSVGDIIRAAQINANFETIRLAINDNDARTDAVAGQSQMPMERVLTAPNAVLCGLDFTYADATAEIEERADDTTRVTVRVFNAKPSHLYTIWLKLDGASPVAPVMGATPLASTDGLANIIANTSLVGPAEASTAAIFQGGNAFYTDIYGNGSLTVFLDFRLSLDIYPFSRLLPVDTYPDFPLSSDPFAFRVISHCQDDVQHGVFAGFLHEPTFELDLPL